MRRARGLHFYTPASTANPTGWRPWISRLSFYSPASYALPSTGTAIPPTRFANGGLGSLPFPNFAGLNRARTWRTRDNASSPTPWIYRTERHGMSGLGVIPVDTVRRAWPYPGAAPVVSTSPQTGTSAPPATLPPGASNPFPGGLWPRYSFPPIRWFASGTPTANSGPSGSFVTSSPQTGSIVSYQPNAGTPIYPYGQQPASSSAAATAVAPSSSTIIGYDANGNPVYQGQTVSAAGLPIASATPPAAAGTSFFSQDSLGLGLNNGIYAAIGLGLVLILKKK
jgi:hypothetical protein